MTGATQAALGGKDVHLDLAFDLIARGIHVDSFDEVELGTKMPRACLPPD